MIGRALVTCTMQITQAHAQLLLARLITCHGGVCVSSLRFPAYRPGLESLSEGGAAAVVVVDTENFASCLPISC